jgi:hypothetical protein
MRVRLLTGMVMLLLIAAPAPLRAEDAKKSKPGVVVRIRPIGELLEDIKFLAKVNQLGDQGDQLEGIIKAKVGDKGLEGIDMKRPLGLYGDIGAAGIDSTVVVLVPITDEKAVLSLLENLNLKAEKEKDGIYSIQVEKAPFPAYLRFANKYAYITARDKTALNEDKLLKPGDVLPAGAAPAISITTQIDQIPEGLKKIFLSLVERGVEEEKTKEKPNDTKEKTAVKIQTMDQLLNGIDSLVNDGGPVTLAVDVDRQSEEISLQFSLAGKPHSGLAKAIANLGSIKSLFAGLRQANSAVSGSVYSLLPEKVRQSFGPMAVDALKDNVKKEKNDEIRKQAEALIDALAPSIKAGELDLGVDLRGPTESKHYTLIGGIKLKDGANVEKAARVLVNDIPEQVRTAIKLDVAKAGRTAIHQVDPGKEMDAEAKKIFGDGPIFLAIRDDALLFAFGEKAQDALKEAIGLTPKTGKPLSLEVSLARLGPLLANTKVGPEYAKQLEKAAAEDQDGLKISATIEGGDALKMRLSTKAKTLFFLVPRGAKREARK